MKKIKLTTTDEVIISADYYQAKSANGMCLLLLHMMPASKESWTDMATAATQAGFNVLAIDLRGHGQSTKKVDQQSLDYKNFSDQQHQESILDIQAAYGYLKKVKFQDNQITLIGASIGANLTLQFLSTHHQIFSAVLLSPGLNYRGIDLKQHAKLLSSSQSFLLISGQEDYYPFQTVKRLNSYIPGATKSIILPTDTHGTDIFKPHPKLISRILRWISQETFS